jgi:hypothetical protein
MYPKKHAGPRELFRIEESQRVDEAATLATKYPQLKSLTAELHFSDSERSTVNSRIKYSINLDVSKSVFRFSCPNNECIRGDYDLSEELADAISERRTLVTGEKSCPGWLSKTTIDTVHCRSILRYRLTIAYVATRARATAAASSR